jgi:hypothetical protein
VYDRLLPLPVPIAIRSSDDFVASAIYSDIIPSDPNPSGAVSSNSDFTWTISKAALVVSVVALGMCIPNSLDGRFRTFEVVDDTEAMEIIPPQTEVRAQGQSQLAIETISTIDDASGDEAKLDRTSAPQIASEAPGDQVVIYLWNVYKRSPTKRDGRGDFTWKDQAAAERMGMSVRDYVIEGMDADFRELLYHAGLAMDRVGVRWTILSGFRDDYRQSIAAGFKAHPGNSFHGGSIATGGYGNGCAVDLASVDGLSNQDVWQWLAAHGGEFGLHRPLPGIDPAHVQPRGSWRKFAAALRRDRMAKDTEMTKADSENSSVTAVNAGGDFRASLQESCTHARLRVQQNAETTSARTSQTQPSTRSKMVKSDQPRTTEPAESFDAPAGGGAAVSKPRAVEGSMWFVQLAGGYSESVALGAYYRQQRKFSRILGAYRPVIAQGGTGYRWYRARIVMETRVTADKLCASLRAAGGDCLVLPR